MAVDLPALVAIVVVEVAVTSTAILEIVCGRNTGTSMSSPSLRKTFINSIPMLLEDRWYVFGCDRRRYKVSSTLHVLLLCNL